MSVHQNGAAVAPLDVVDVVAVLRRAATAALTPEHNRIAERMRALSTSVCAYGADFEVTFVVQIAILDLVLSLRSSAPQYADRINNVQIVAPTLVAATKFLFQLICVVDFDFLERAHGISAREKTPRRIEFANARTGERLVVKPVEYRSDKLRGDDDAHMIIVHAELVLSSAHFTNAVLNRRLAFDKSHLTVRAFIAAYQSEPTGLAYARKLFPREFAKREDEFDIDIGASHANEKHARDARCAVTSFTPDTIALYKTLPASMLAVNVRPSGDDVLHLRPLTARTVDEPFKDKLRRARTLRAPRSTAPRRLAPLPPPATRRERPGRPPSSAPVPTTRARARTMLPSMTRHIGECDSPPFAVPDMYALDSSPSDDAPSQPPPSPSDSE